MDDENNSMDDSQEEEIGAEELWRRHVQSNSGALQNLAGVSPEADEDMRPLSGRAKRAAPIGAASVGGGPGRAAPLKAALLGAARKYEAP
ncbi:hypothetical protein R1sor_027321 [Riccia sorocarpa]|uniref:Uncharacterized protein n=1 Tax=Riccia sorocarpa TaxID=122646 RepID=A0ABD3GDX9_9MARC